MKDMRDLRKESESEKGRIALSLEPGEEEKKMGEHKIVHLTSVHPPFDVRIFYKECVSIARAGYNVTLIACHDRDEMKDGVRLKAISKPSGRISRVVRGGWAIYHEAWQQAASLYHFHDPELIGVGLILRLRGKNVVYDVHEDVPSDVAYKYYIPRFLRQPLASVLGFVEKATARAFSAVVAATYPIGERLSFLNGRTVIVRNFPRLEETAGRIQESWTKRKVAVAYVGSISRDRGATEMVRAMNLLPETIPATLYLAGAFSPDNLREELVKTAGWNRVRDLGTLGRTEVMELLGNVRAGLATFKATPGFVKGTPTKMLEYMNAGIPVIASDFPGFRKIVEGTRCGVLVNPLDPRAIAQAIEYIFEHPEEAEKMGQRGQEAVQSHYNWATEERKLLTLYDTLMKSSCAA